MTSLPELLARVKMSGPDDCWPWTGKTDSRGRGRVWVDGKLKLAHRAVWEAIRGPIPAGKFLCHHCDNGGCLNLSHVYIGTHADNMRDMTERRRYFAAKEPERVRELGRVLGSSNTWARGELNPKAKLTPSNVSAIRADHRATRFIAAEYGVDRTTIQRIRRGAQWTNS